MKKFILILCFLGLCSCGFARIFIQQDVEAVGVMIDSYHDCFDEVNPDTYSASFVPLSGFSGLAGWEFNPLTNKAGEELPICFYAGLDFGFAVYGLSLAAAGGCSWNICNVGNLLLQLNATIEAGPVFDIFGGVEFMEQTAVDFVISKQDHKGIYGGIGITNMTFPYVSYYKGYGFKSNCMTYLGGHIVAGYRF